jgi:hypothetical protein
MTNSDLASLMTQYVTLMTQLNQTNQELATLLVELVRLSGEGSGGNNILESAKVATLRALSTEDNALQMSEERVLAKIRRKESMTRKDIGLAFSGRLNSVQLTIILVRLERLGLVRSRIVPGRGRPLTTYSAT